MNLPVTKNFDFLDALPSPKKAPVVILEGSTRSSKTISICQYLILECLANSGLIVNCFRHDGTRHDQTTIEDFKFVMRQLAECYDMDFNDWWEEGTWQEKKKVYVFANGAKFGFKAADKDKLHGVKQDIAWLNEVMEIHYPPYRQIAQRTRLRIIFDYNPSFNRHWLFEKVMKRPDCKYCHSTYTDNPFLSSMQVAEIECTEPTPENIQAGTVDEWHWEVYGLGKRGKIEGAVYKHYELIDPDQYPAITACQRHGYAMDFGFFPDPASLLELRYWNRGLYLRELMYEKKLLITPNIAKPSLPSIKSRLDDLKVAKSSRIIADNARPDSIRDLNVSGYNVVPCKKGKDSVLHGIRVVQSIPLFVVRGSQNLQHEFEHYQWKKDPRGDYLSEPVDKDNHLMDPLRYFVYTDLSFLIQETQRRDNGQRPTRSTTYTRRRSRGKHY